MKAVIAIVTSTVGSIWVIGLLPLDSLHIHGPWLSICYRLVDTLLSLALIKIFCPASLQRLTLKIKRSALAVITALVALFASLSIAPGIGTKSTSHMIWVGVIFSLTIGIDEEIYSRGLIYGVLERYGPSVAILGSSIDFGLLHLTNYFYGGQRFDTTLAQMAGATAFGSMTAAAMLCSGTIWPSVVIHGLTDLQLSQVSSMAYAKNLLAKPDWVGTVFEMLLYTSIGFLLLLAAPEAGSSWRVWCSRVLPGRKLTPLAIYLGLTSSPRE
jgi:membrane protease YdiL (CAAX protease family)